MPLPQGYLPRKNDELLIRVKVRSDYRDDGSELVSVAVSGSEHRHLFVNLDKIHSLFCRAWNEGDKVTTGDFEGPGEVIQTHDEWVWVKALTDDTKGCEGLLFTCEANELEPYVAPEPEPQRMTEEDLMRGLEPLIPPPAPGSQAVVEDDDDIKF